MGFYSSFVVKVWLNENGKMIWGQIQHVGTQESVHFLNTDKMLSFFEDHLIPPANGFNESQISSFGIPIPNMGTPDE